MSYTIKVTYKQVQTDWNIWVWEVRGSDGVRYAHGNTIAWLPGSQKRALKRASKVVEKYKRGIAVEI